TGRAGMWLIGDPLECRKSRLALLIGSPLRSVLSAGMPTRTSLFSRRFRSRARATSPGPFLVTFAAIYTETCVSRRIHRCAQARRKTKPEDGSKALGEDWPSTRQGTQTGPAPTVLAKLASCVP